ncbi:MAG: acyltransferase, partial [Mycobacterium sp.]
ATAAGALICAAGVALVMMAKFGLSGASGWTALGCFVVAVAGARFCAGAAGTVSDRRAPRSVGSRQP